MYFTDGKYTFKAPPTDSQLSQNERMEAFKEHKDPIFATPFLSQTPVSCEIKK